MPPSDALPRNPPRVSAHVRSLAVLGLAIHAHSELQGRDGRCKRLIDAPCIANGRVPLPARAECTDCRAQSRLSERDGTAVGPGKGSGSARGERRAVRTTAALAALHSATYRDSDDLPTSRDGLVQRLEKGAPWEGASPREGARRDDDVSMPIGGDRRRGADAIGGISSRGGLSDGPCARWKKSLLLLALGLGP